MFAAPLSPHAAAPLALRPSDTIRTLPHTTSPRASPVSLLDRLLNRNPTRDWRPEPGLVLLLNLDEESFCGVRLGEPAARLRKLGPTPNAGSARIGMYEYAERGFLVTAEQDRFVEVNVSFAGNLGAFTGTIRRHGRDGTLDGSAGEENVVALLGPADERKETAAEEYLPATIMLSWHLHRTDCQANFEDRRLTDIWLGSKF